MHDVGFGQTFPYLGSSQPCSPWTDIGLYRTDTGEGLKIPFVRHWSYSPTNKLMYFAVYSDNVTEAIDTVNTIFDNKLNPDPLPIEVRPSSNVASVPADYDPSTLDSFTFVYGRGDEYEGTALDGRSRRRMGSTQQGRGTRDYTVFTINWFAASARLQAGSTYVNKGYFMNSDLGSVKATAEDLLTKTFVDEIDLELWLPRAVNVYQHGTTFEAVSSLEAGGTLTTCDNLSANLVCSGTSTPKLGHVPFFYMSCGGSTYFGPDPYTFTPPFSNLFPGHGNMTNPVRSYACVGEDASVRPSWTLVGFFNPTTCTSLSTATYGESTCNPLSAGQGHCSHDLSAACSADADCQATCARRELTVETEANQFEQMLRGGIQRMLQGGKATCASEGQKSSETIENGGCGATSGGSKNLPCCTDLVCEGEQCVVATNQQTSNPTNSPTSSPINPSNSPTASPSKSPTLAPNPPGQVCTCVGLPTPPPTTPPTAPPTAGP